MAEAVAKAQPSPKKEVRKTGVSTMDETFARIREERAAARSSLKELRKEFKKDCWVCAHTVCNHRTFGFINIALLLCLCIPYVLHY